MYEIRVYHHSRNAMLKHHFELIQDGFYFNAEKKYYFQHVNTENDSKIVALKKKWQHIGFKTAIINLNYKRSSNYRDTFFSQQKPFWKQYYFCAYCGRLITKNKITVDHLYPVAAVRKSPMLQKKINLNGYSNLVPACKSCNSKKGMKMGFWILRGKLGKNSILWCIRWVLRFILVACVACISLQAIIGIQANSGPLII